MKRFFSDIPAGACDRARTGASQALDGELSELERAALETHLSGCADCRRFVASMERTTVALRAAPLEPVGTWTAVPLRRHRRKAGLAVLAAAAVAASVLVGAAIGTLSRHGGGPVPSASAPGGFIATQQPYREQSLLALLPRLHQRPSRVVAV